MNSSNEGSSILFFIENLLENENYIINVNSKDDNKKNFFTETPEILKNEANFTNSSERDDCDNLFQYNKNVFVKGKIDQNQKLLISNLISRDILVIEDDGFNQLNLESLFNKKSMTIHKTYTGIEGIETLENTYYGIKNFENFENSFKLILIAKKFNDINGIETSINIKNMMENKKMPIIPIIGMIENKSDIEECLESGMNDYILKPIDMRNLDQIINEWILDGKNKN